LRGLPQFRLSERTSERHRWKLTGSIDLIIAGPSNVSAGVAEFGVRLHKLGLDTTFDSYITVGNTASLPHHSTAESLESGR
jgi:hypothetical protein